MPSSKPRKTDEEREWEIILNRKRQRRYREKIREDPESEAAYRRYQSEWSKRHWQNIKGDPQKLEKKRKRERERYHRKKEKKG